MKNKIIPWKSCLALAMCLSISPLLMTCAEKDSNRFEGVHSFIVTVVPVSGNYGTEDAPLKFPTHFSNNGQCDGTCYDVMVGAYAVDIEGNFLPNYNGTVNIISRPGKLNVQKVTFQNGMLGSWQVANGKPQQLTAGIPVGMRYAYGDTRIWVEDTDRTLVPMTGICQNNNHTEDGKYCEPSMATGTSELFTFEPQTIKMIQYNPDMPAGDSPLIREYGQLKAIPGHDLVVTNVVSTGFYVSDLGDPDYNSVFVFSYSQPARVEIGDRVCEISGGISEFTGMTQLQFPSWGIQNKERSTAEDTDPAPDDGEDGAGTCIDKETGLTRPCTEEEIELMADIVDCSAVYNNGVKLEGAAKKAFGHVSPPEPRVLNPDVLDLANVGKLEALEASTVTVQNIRLSTDFIDCDDNGNGKIESGTEEADCRTQCQSNSMTCTEISSLESYDQWRAWTLEGSAEISVASSSLIAGFNITSDCYSWIDPNSNRRMMRCPERRLKRLTGTLKQVLPTCSGTAVCDAGTIKRKGLVMTVIEPRMNTDLIMDEEYNLNATAEFQACIADTRPGGCLETCKMSGNRCTCQKFADYVDSVRQTRDPSLPTSCL